MADNRAVKKDKYHLPDQTMNHKFRAVKRMAAIDGSVVTGHPDFD